MTKGSTKLTKNQKAELKALEALPDEYIDTAAAPENLDWSNAERGVFYRPVKQQITFASGCGHIALVSGYMPVTDAVTRPKLTVHCANM